MIIVQSIQPDMQLLNEFINFLDGYAVNYRYPGISAEKSDAKIAINAIGEIRNYFMRILS